MDTVADARVDVALRVAVDAVGEADVGVSEEFLRPDVAVVTDGEAVTGVSGGELRAP